MLYFCLFACLVVSPVSTFYIRYTIIPYLSVACSTLSYSHLPCLDIAYFAVLNPFHSLTRCVILLSIKYYRLGIKYLATIIELKVLKMLLKMFRDLLIKTNWSKWSKLCHSNTSLNLFWYSILDIGRKKIIKYFNPNSQYFMLNFDPCQRFTQHT